MDPHTSDEMARRAATVLTMLIDQREKADALAHDLEAWQTRANFFEEKLNELGWQLVFEDNYPKWVYEKPKVRINAKGEKTDGEDST